MTSPDNSHSDLDRVNALASLREQERADILSEFMHAGRYCTVVRIKLGEDWSHYCGYARTSLTHQQLFEGEIAAVEVHGGLTYGPDDEGYVGFDTLHSSDVNEHPDGEVFGSQINQIHSEMTVQPVTRWSPEKVEEEVRRLAQQLRAMERGRDVDAP